MSRGILFKFIAAPGRARAPSKETKRINELDNLNLKPRNILGVDPILRVISKISIRTVTASASTERLGRTGIRVMILALVSIWILQASHLESP